MFVARPFVALLLAALTPAWAQSSSPPLNLRLPEDVQNAPATEAAPSLGPEVAADPAAQATPLLPSPYAQTYGDRRDAARKVCDDAIYAQPQVHGNVEMGVAAGNHFSGNYQAATVGVAKALGSCDDPKGAVGASISVSKDDSSYRRRGRP